MAAERLDHVLVKDGPALRAAGLGRLAADGPERRPRAVPDIDPDSVTIARRIRPPARQGIALPEQPPGPRFRDACGHPAISQHMDLRNRGIGGRNPRRRNVRSVVFGVGLPGLVDPTFLDGRIPGHAFVQKKVHGLKGLLAHRSPDLDVAQQNIGDRDQGHALVMRHVGAHGDEPVRPRQAAGREIESIDESEGAERSQLLERLEIQCRRFGPDAEREGRCIGRNHQVVRQAALDAQSRNTEGAILVVSAGVGQSVGRFRDAPGDPPLRRVAALILHRRRFALAQKRVPAAGQEERRHEVFEHRSAPGQDRRFAPQPGDRPTKREPVLDRSVVLGDGEIARQTGLGRQQIVVIAIHPPDAVVVADHEEPRLGVVEKGEVHPVGERVTPLGQGAEVARKIAVLGNPFFDGAPEVGKPGMTLLRCRGIGRELADLVEHPSRALDQFGHPLPW